jgi:hypothetical protein
MVPKLGVAVDGAEAKWCAHEFDLLGSGPTRVSLGMADPLSDLPRPWHGRCRELSGLLPQGYTLVDWQLDPKSGFRWSARQWHGRVVYGSLPGVEVKWPWELSRLQHLPAMAGRLAGSEAALRSRIESEIRAQIIDFVMQNPPGFGVNWACAMDVGIRIANIAVAVDAARASGALFDNAFLTLVSASLRDHCRFLVRNLEWGAGLCSNHYLGDIVGLLYAASYLPGDGESLQWLAFAGREIGLQIRQQFQPDGSNFEASTCYHRLSAEMVVYAAALMLHIARTRPEDARAWWSGEAVSYHPEPVAPPLDTHVGADGIAAPFSEADVRRLEGMALFTHSLVRADGSVPQIGDNDSGRFMRIGYGIDPYADLVCHTHLPAAFDALFRDASGLGRSPESAWLRDWVGGAGFMGRLSGTTGGQRFQAFPDFGLFIWNRGRFRLTLRCGHVGQNGNGGHAHCDQLAITMDLDGLPLVIDAGTGSYTPDPDARNRFRGVASHSTIVIPGREPNEWLAGRWGLFSMKDNTRAAVLEAGNDGAVVEHSGYGQKVARRICVRDDGFDLLDQIGKVANEAFSQMLLHPGVEGVMANGGVSLFATGSSGAASAHCASSGTIWVEPALASPWYGTTVPTKVVRWRGGNLNLSLV